MSQQPESAARVKPSRGMSSSKQLPWRELTNVGVPRLGTGKEAERILLQTSHSQGIKGQKG